MLVAKCNSDAGAGQRLTLHRTKTSSFGVLNIQDSVRDSVLLCATDHTPRDSVYSTKAYKCNICLPAYTIRRSVSNRE